MYVYLIRSCIDPKRLYIGRTEDFARRLSEHNDGKSTATYKFMPWRCEVLIWFYNSYQAAAFELYLKGGSGRAFAERHLWSNKIDKDHPP
jgi:predicted GIY-YIG superfamily endonuclease